MDERTLHDILSGNRRGIGASMLRGALSLASMGYGAAIALRNAAFDHGWRRVHRVPVPVISVGNITTGGTGKTPFVAWLINELRRQGMQPGLLSRGYRSLDGLTNDEARVIERLCPGVPHVQNCDRVAGARALLGREQLRSPLPTFRWGERARVRGAEGDTRPLTLALSPADGGEGTRKCDAIILDDAFQHRRLNRDLDIVLIDALQPWGYGRLLPRGLLREPPEALRRADVAIITRADQVEPSALEDLRHQVRIVRGIGVDGEISFRPTRLVNTAGQTRPLSSLAGQSIAAFCGIGNPVGFEQMLTQLGATGRAARFPIIIITRQMTSLNWNRGGARSARTCW